MRTDKRLWFWASIVLFVVPWFVPLFYAQGSPLPPAFLVLALFVNPALEGLGIVVKYALLFGTTAVALGWLLQCAVVMIRHARKK
jgi:hypothetical protein